MAYQYQQVQSTAAASAYQNGYPPSVYLQASANTAFSPAQAVPATFQYGHPQYQQPQNQYQHHHHQQQQRQVYNSQHHQQILQSLYGRRDSLSVLAGQISMSSTAASTPPASWGSPSLQDPYVGTPSPSQSVTVRYGQPQQHIPAGAQTSVSAHTPTKGPFNKMSPAAPAFTPLGLGVRAASPFSNNSNSSKDIKNQVGNGLEQEARFLPERRGSLPRFHKTAPSVATADVGYNGDVRRGGVSPHKSLARSPLASRGVSPVGSNFSSGTDSAPLLNTFGLPIGKARTYKVKFPLETDLHSLDADTRKRSRWRRQPLSHDPNQNHEDSVENVDSARQEVRCKSPHPGDRIQPDELPDSLEIYLPNDWATLRQALFEERMAKIGIDKDYLRNMDVRLNAIGHGQFPNRMNSQAHTRSGSLFAAPQSRTPDLALLSPTPIMPPSVFRKSHGAALSLAFASGSTFTGKAQGFLRQQPPFGPRDIPASLQRAAIEAPSKLFNGFSIPTAVEEDEEEENHKGILVGNDKAIADAARDDHADRSALVDEILRPAKTLSLRELAAGFGISSDTDEDGHDIELVPASSPNDLSTGQEQENPIHVAHGRAAVEGVVGHHPLPSSGSLADDMAIKQVASTLPLPYNPRRSVSAPDLHEKLATVLQQAPSSTSDGGYTAEEDDEAAHDSGSVAGTEYSNPSDEERAKVRRDEALRKRDSLSALFPTAENWLDRGESEAVVSNPSDEDESTTRHLPWSLAHSATASPADYLHHHHQLSALNRNPHNSPPKPSVLNVNAPSFVYGAKPAVSQRKDSSASSSFSYEGSKLTLADARAASKQVQQVRSLEAAKARLNVAAPVFMPSLPLKTTILNTSATEFIPPHFAMDSDASEFMDSRKLDETLDSKLQADVWLSDVTTPEAAVPHHSHLETTVDSLRLQDQVGTIVREDPMLTFKFPPSPHLKPVSPQLQPSPLSTGAPQIPPLVAISGNTFQNALSEYPHEESPTVSGNLVEVQSKVPSTKSRPPIPSFDPPAENCGLQPSDTVPLSPLTPLHPKPSSELPVSEFGNESRMLRIGKVQISHMDDVQENALKDKPAASAGSLTETASESEMSLSSCVPSSIARAYQQSRGSRHSLTRTWKIFEAILDRKLDVLRQDVFSNSTPLPPPSISAEAQEALAAAVVEAVRDEMPLETMSGSKWVGSSASGPLLEAIHDAQNMLQDFRGRSDESIKDLVDMLQTHISDAPDKSAEDSSSLAARVIEGINAELLASRAQLMPDLDQLTTRLADAVKPQLYSLIDLAGDKKETAALVVDELEPRLQSLLREQITILAQTHKAQESAHSVHIATAIHQAVFECIPDLVHSLLPSMVPVPSSPTSNVDDLRDMLVAQSKLQAASTNSMKVLENRIDKSNAKLYEYQKIQNVLSEVRANTQRLQAELEVQQRTSETDRAKHSNEVQYFRNMISNKDKQLEVVRNELLNRATNMDQEAKEKDQEHARRIKEMEALCGGMQTELSILRTHAKEAAARRDELQLELDKTQKQLYNLDKQHHTELSLVAERESNSRERQKAYEQRDQQLTLQMAKMQEILGDEASHRIRLEDRISKLMLQSEKHLEEKAHAEQVLQSLRDELAAERAKVAAANLQQATKDAHSIGVAQQAATDIERLQQANQHLATVAEQAYQSMLSYILSRDAELCESSFPVEAIFETCLAVDSDSQGKLFKASEISDLASSEGETSKTDQDAATVRVDEILVSDMEASEEDTISERYGVKSVVIDDSGWFT